MTISQQQVMDWLTAYAGVLQDKRDYLTELDSAIGDADHGANMDRGFQAVQAKLSGSPQADIGAIFKTTAMTLITTVGGASGPLYGTFFLQAASKTSGKSELDLAEWTALMEAALAGVIARGKAQMGDKTMIDALTPAVEALKKALAEGVDIHPALELSTEAARQGMEDTTPLVARKGRASYLGERSAGHQDPGATSTYYLLKSAAENLG